MTYSHLTTAELTTIANFFTQGTKAYKVAQMLKRSVETIYRVYQKVVLKALKHWNHPRKVLWLRKVDRTIQDSIFTDVLDCLSTWQLLPLCRVNKSNRTINLPNGAVFLFKGMDDPEKIKSIKGLSDVVMEEASEFNQDDFTQLTLRLREPKHKQRQLFCMFNPVSKLNWTYKQWFDPDVEVDTNRVAIRTIALKVVTLRNKK